MDLTQSEMPREIERTVSETVRSTETAMGKAGQRPKSRRKFLDSVWTAMEKEHGTRVPLRARQFLEDYMGLKEPAYPDEHDVCFVIGEFIEHGLPALNRYLDETMASRGRSSTVGKRCRAGSLERPRLYAKPLARRLRRLSFVAEIVVPFANLAQGNFDWAGRTIPWEDVEARWNQGHPDEKMSAKAFERAFRRDRSDQRLRELYFDSDFRDWAREAERLRHTLNSLGMAGLRPEDVFVRFVTTEGNTEPDTRGLPPELASAIRHVASYKKWAQISVRLPPALGRAFERAVRRRCGLTVDRVAYPHDEHFCEGPHCRKCKVGAELVKVGFARQEDLVELTAAGAGERHRRRLDESAQNWRKLFEFANRRSRG